MAQSPASYDDQEIDLKAIKRGISRSVDRVNFSTFRLLRFIRRNIIIVVLLLIAGAVLGYFMDKGRIYRSSIIVSPYHGCTDYMYDKIRLIESKVKNRDTAFLKSIGVKHPNKLLKIEIAPINDVYQFVNTDSKNFELLRLMMEDGDVKKVINDPTTTKNYPRHLISLTTKEVISEEGMVEPIMTYLNQSSFYKAVQRQYVTNVKEKLVKNEQTIAQIDGLLERFAQKSASSGSSSPSLVYYNDNTQLNDVLKTKDELIREQGLLRLDLISLDAIIKRNSTTLNVREAAGAMKFILPLVFFGLFLIIGILRKGYTSQKAKYANA